MPKVDKTIPGMSEDERRLKLGEVGLEVVDSKVCGEYVRVKRHRNKTQRRS